MRKIKKGVWSIEQQRIAAEVFEILHFMRERKGRISQ